MKSAQSLTTSDNLDDAYFAAVLAAESIVVDGIERYFHDKVAVRLVGGKAIARRVWTDLDALLHLPLIRNAQEVLGPDRYKAAEARWVARNTDKIDA